MEWLRCAPLPGHPRSAGTPLPLLRRGAPAERAGRRLRRSPRCAVARWLARFWREVDTVALFADFGFAPRTNFFGEGLGQRAAPRCCRHAGDGRPRRAVRSCFRASDDPQWLRRSTTTLARLAEALAPVCSRTAPARAAGRGHRYPAASGARLGTSGALRQRMSAELLADDPFRQLALQGRRALRKRRAVRGRADAREARYLRAVLDACRPPRRACAHLERARHLGRHRVPTDQLRARSTASRRCSTSAPRSSRRRAAAPAAMLARGGEARHPQRSARHYALLARKVRAQRRDRRALHHPRPRRIPRHAGPPAGRRRGDRRHHLGVKFGVAAMGLAAFWSGPRRAQLCGQLRRHPPAALDGGHQQPAMTAPAMAARS